MFCPACREENPDRNRFCGQCGRPLSAPVCPAGQFGNETASRVGPSSFPLQDVIAQSRRGPNGDAGLPNRGPQGDLTKGSQLGSRPRSFQALPKEVIDYDNGLPLLAEPGMDRRRQTPDPVRQAMQEVWGNSAESPDPEGLWNSTPDSLSQAGCNPESSILAAFAGSGVEELTPPAEVPAPASGLPTGGKIGFNPVDQLHTEPRKPAELPAEAPAAEDLSRFLDFTPAHHDESGSLSGPSFLGLSGAAESLVSEEESQARQWPRYVVAAVIAALVGLTAMHWTSVRGAAARYARLGTTYVEMLRVGKTGSSAQNSEPASAGPASPVSPAAPVSPISNDKAASDFALAQHPAQPVAPESPAPSASPVPLNSTNLNLEGKAGSGDSAGQTQAVGPGQPAASRARPAASNPSDQQFSKPVAGQREYQQALGATNPEVARALLWRSTALGNPDAQVRLADMYIYGQGVPKNCDQGLILLRLAAQRANPQAQAKLGALYATGVCVSQDRVQAYRWLTLALKDGHPSEWTEQNRQMVWRQMSPEERSRAATATR